MMEGKTIAKRIKDSRFNISRKAGDLHFCILDERSWHVDLDASKFSYSRGKRKECNFVKITPLRLIILFLAKVHYNHRIKILDCPRGYTSSYALLQTNSARLGVTLADPLESSDINDDACIAK